MTAIASVQSQRTAPPAGGQDYVVQRGDTLWDISRRNGISLDSLIRANPQIDNPDLILIGQHINVPGRGGVGGGSGGAVEASTAAGLPTSGPHANAAAVAEQYLGRNASDLRSDRSDNLPMQAGVPTNVCCANFVSAVLTEAGQLPANLHTNSVRQLDSTLRSQGWTEVPASQARPGDVVIIQGGGVSHTVLVSGPGQTIGSNNRNADGSQRVTHGSLSWALDHGAKILRAPASVTGGTTGATTGASGSAAAGAVRASAVDGPILRLSAQDVADLKRVVATEWGNRSTEQAHGIIDTILNRQASGRWGTSVADVANARSQFSDINGPVAWRQGRNSVDDIPASRVSQRVNDLVDAYLAQRAGGTPSSVGDHLNYANPNYSDRSNLGWINRLDGPVLGEGRNIHRHGTTPDLERHRPGAFTVVLPGR